MELYNFKATSEEDQLCKKVTKLEIILPFDYHQCQIQILYFIFFLQTITLVSESYGRKVSMGIEHALECICMIVFCHYGKASYAT